MSERLARRATVASMAAALVLFVVTDFEIFKQYQGISRLKDEFVSTVSHELRR